MLKIQNAKKFIKDKDYRFKVLALNGLFSRMPDEEYIKKMYRARMGKELNLTNPKTLNEKLQWLKIHDHSPLYSRLVDKYEVKAFVGNLIGYEYIIPTIGVWDKFDDIDFSKLPNQFVLKCTHDSHSLVICKDKNTLNIQETKKRIQKALNQKYYLRYREWAYKNVPHRIIAEKYIEDETGFLTDYKFYCFNGKPEYVLSCYDRMMGETKYYFFDRNWQLKRINKQGMEAPEGFTKPKPDNLDKMFELAEILAKASGAPFIRVDFYNVQGQLFFGELTLYPVAGFDMKRLPETDELFGEKVDLSKIHNSL